MVINIRRFFPAKRAVQRLVLSLRLNSLDEHPANPCESTHSCGFGPYPLLFSPRHDYRVKINKLSIWRAELAISVVNYLFWVVIVQEIANATALLTQSTMADAHSTPNTTIFKIAQPSAISMSATDPKAIGSKLQCTGLSLIMPGCIVITAQDIRALWHGIKGLSREPFDEHAAAEWLNRFPVGWIWRGISK